jgi:hypothetical protein
MQKQDITTWLDSNDHDWKQGLALLVAFSNNKHLIRVFTSKCRSVRTTKSLQYELNKISKAGPSSRLKQGELLRKSPVVSHPTKTVNPTLKTSNYLLRPTIGEQSTDPVLIPLETKRKALYVEAASIFYQLLYMTKPMCEISCLRILDMMDDNKALWHQIDYYKKYKFLPSSADVSSQLEMKDRLHNIRTYISRHIKQVANAKTETTRLKYQQRLDEFIAERNDIELKLSI